MDNNLGTIWSQITLDYRQFDQAIDHITQQHRWLDAQTKQAMENIAAHYERMGKRMSLAITTPLALLSRQWIRTFADFQQSMANTQSVMGATAAELERLTGAARKAGEETIFKASQAADALYYLGQAGMDAAQSIDALDGVLTMAVASQADLEFASEVVAATLSQFGLAASEATRVANLFAAANADSLASLDKLAASMKYVGPIAAGFGYSIEETTAALMALYNAGFAGEQAGTILRRAIVELANPVGDAVNVIRELGLSVEDLHPEMNSLADILDKLSSRGITTTQVARLFGQVAGPGMIQLLSIGSDALRQYEQSITGTNKAFEQAAIQLDTLQGDIRIMQSVYESMVLQMTGNFEPALRAIVRAITDLYGWIRDLNPETQRLIVTLGAFAAAAGPVMLIISQLLKVLPLLLGPAGWIYGGVAAVTALALAFSNAERDMREFYQQSIDTSKELERQATELRSLVNEYKYLEGKPDKSAEEHRRLQTVMERIIELQPDLARGYETIDEAIQANIGTLETYIDTLEKQSQLSLELAALDYTRQRYQLQQQLNEALEKQAELEQRIKEELGKGVDWANLAAEAEIVFAQYLDALRQGRYDLAEQAEETMRVIFSNITSYPFGERPEVETFQFWQGWVDQIRRMSSHSSEELKSLSNELDKVSEKITILQDTITYGQAAMDALERSRAGLPIEPEAPAKIEETLAATVEVIEDASEKTAENLEESLSLEMSLYRAKIDLVRHAGEQYESVYGSLEQVHKDYIEFLKTNVYDRQLEITEQFRASMAVELGKVRESLEALSEQTEIEKPVDPESVVLATMQVFNAELELLRLGIEQYEDDLGSLQEHLTKYSDWLSEQLSDTALSPMIHARVAETRKKIEQELAELAVSTEEIWQRILEMTEYYGPLAERIRQALETGEITVDTSNLELALQYMENFYRYLVESEQVSFEEHLEVLNHQLRQVVAGSEDWIRIWREIHRVQESLEAPEETVSRTNEALEKQLEIFEQLKHTNAEVVDSYAKQAKWLEENALILAQSERERRQIGNEIFALQMEHFNELATAQNWTAEQQLDYLDKILAKHAQSFDQIMTITDIRRRLEAQAAAEAQRTENERLRIAREVNYGFMELEIERLHNMGQIRKAELAEAYLQYRREYDAAEGNLQLQEIAYQRYLERMRTLGRQDGEQAIQEAQEIAYKMQEITIQRLENEGKYREADIQRAILSMNRQLDMHRDNQQMIALIKEEHEAKLEAIAKKYDEQRLAEAMRAEEEWQRFLVESRQVTAQQVLREQIRQLKMELALVGDNEEKKLELSRKIEQARHELAKQTLEDDLALIRAKTLQEGLDTATRLDFIRRIRQEYEALYGENYRLSTEWQQLLQEELALQEQLSLETAQTRIKEIQVNEQSIESLINKRDRLLDLIDATQNYIELQEYLNELLKVQDQINQAQQETLSFFVQSYPKVGEYTNQLFQMIKLIKQSPQAFENMRYSMNQMFGDYGDWMAALYGAISGFVGAGGDTAGVISSITGAVAGITGDPLYAAISAGVSLIGKLFDPGPIPRDAETLKESIKQVNEALEEFGVAYRALELQIKKERFLGFLWQTGWKITNEEAAKAGYEAAQAMINSMNTSLRSLGSLMAEVVADRATWDDFEVVLGQQLRRIMMEQIMAAAQFEEQAKLLVGMMQESVAGGFTEAEIEAIKQGWRTLMESLETEWERYSSILDDIFPEDEELLVRHEVSGVRITRLAGQDRDMFVELLRPISVLEQLPGLLDQRLVELYQNYQTGQIAQLHAAEIIMDYVIIERAEFNGPIQNLNVNGESLDQAIERKVTQIINDATTIVSASGG